MSIKIWTDEEMKEEKATEGLLYPLLKKTQLENTKQVQILWRELMDERTGKDDHLRHEDVAGIRILVREDLLGRCVRSVEQYEQSPFFSRVVATHYIWAIGLKYDAVYVFCVEVIDAQLASYSRISNPLDTR